jgi:16S rRNA (uracil1498-N3)-methyltransferase
MRLHRFYVNFPLGEEVVVENKGVEKESNSKLLHQWTNVFRYTSGDEVILFSPFTSGLDFHYTISALSKQAATLGLISSSKNIVSPFDVTLVMALVKKDTFETIVRQATELGVSHIIPIEAARSEKKNLNFERLEAISIEASEQSGRGEAPTIGEITTFSEALKQSSPSTNIFGSLHGKDISELKEEGVFKGTKKITLWIGPEGGWTDEEEQEALENGMFPFKLTDTVLKADTAATSLLATLIASVETK